MEHTIETDEHGALTLSPELIGSSKPHTRYVVENQGERLILRQAAQNSEATLTRQKQKLTAAEWREEWEAWSKQVTKAWNSDQTAAEIVAELRTRKCYSVEQALST